MYAPKIWIAQAVVVLMLLMALFGGMSGDFWTLLRVVVSVAFLWIGYLFFERQLVGWMIISGAVVILFNPISPFYLGREIWVIVDVGVVAVSIYSVYLLRTGTKRSSNSKE